jgi:hypothetical protein
MTFNKLLIVLVFTILTISGHSQMRYGNCRSANSQDRFYITPYVGIGRSTITTSFLKDKSTTWVAGITAHYMFNSFRLGLGARYQEYTKFDYTFLKPYISFEYPIYFDEFQDFGFYAQIGPALGQDEIPDLSGVFGDLGIFYNYVITPSSGIWAAIDFSYNDLSYPLGVSTQEMKITEFKLLVGYRFWF